MSGIWAGALFAVHPVHAENIMYLVGRADILCALGFAGAALLWEAGWSAPALLSVRRRDPRG